MTRAIFETDPSGRVEVSIGRRYSALSDLQDVETGRVVASLDARQHGA